MSRSAPSAGSVTLDAAALPAGVTAAFAPAVLTASQTTSTLTLTVAAGATAGQFPVTVRATSATATAGSATIPLTVLPPASVGLAATVPTAAIAGLSTAAGTSSTIKGQVTTRYYGWYANRPRGMRAKATPAAADGPPAIVPAPRLASTEASRRWAALLQQLFEVDPLACPACHGAMRIVAFITQAAVIDQILTHLRSRAAHATHAGARSPPSTRAPASRSTARAPRPPADAPTPP